MSRLTKILKKPINYLTGLDYEENWKEVKHYIREFQEDFLRKYNLAGMKLNKTRNVGINTAVTLLELLYTYNYVKDNSPRELYLIGLFEALRNVFRYVEKKSIKETLSEMKKIRKKSQLKHQELDEILLEYDQKNSEE